MRIRIGNGFDVHRLVADRPLILGGVMLDWHLGLDGHSDADVLLHALCDALLGAAGLGDIGQHFPPSDNQYKDKDSRVFVRHVHALVNDLGYEIANIDCTIVAEKPKMAPHIAEMEANISSDLGITANRINVKATTTEGLGLCGREEGIAAFVSVLIQTND